MVGVTNDSIPQMALFPSTTATLLEPLEPWLLETVTAPSEGLAVPATLAQIGVDCFAGLC